MARRRYNPAVSADTSGRLWRLRKLHQQVDATLRDRASGEIELRFFYNGELAFTRVWPTRALALEQADAKREELEREGWTAHW